MPYPAQTSRTSPACVLLLVDHSKAVAAADAVNRLLRNPARLAVDLAPPAVRAPELPPESTP